MSGAQKRRGALCPKTGESPAQVCCKPPWAVSQPGAYGKRKPWWTCILLCIVQGNLFRFWDGRFLCHNFIALFVAARGKDGTAGQGNWVRIPDGTAAVYAQCLRP